MAFPAIAKTSCQWNKGFAGSFSPQRGTIGINSIATAIFAQFLRCTVKGQRPRNFRRTVDGMRFCAHLLEVID